MKNREKRIEKFIKSRDYRDIYYFITHVKKIEFRKSLLEELGYHIGCEFPKTEIPIGHVFFGKKNDLRMYISPKFPQINLAYSIILDNY